MKTINLYNDGEKKQLREWLMEARAMEKGDTDQATKEYRKITRAYPTSETAYDRLMVLYRLQKNYKDELTWIDKAIKVFNKTYNNSARKPNAKVTAISKSLIRSLGLADKKGRFLHQPQPIARWEKRRLLLINKNK